MNKQEVGEMLHLDQSEWDLLASILDAHPEESLHDPQSQPWTSRDVYAHLARWIEYSNKDLENYCAGLQTSSPVEEPDLLNARWQQEDSGMTLQEARRKAFTALACRQRILASIPEDRWDQNLTRIARFDGAEHYRAHRGYIRL